MRVDSTLPSENDTSVWNTICWCSIKNTFRVYAFEKNPPECSFIPARAAKADRICWSDIFLLDQRPDSSFVTCSQTFVLLWWTLPLERWGAVSSSSRTFGRWWISGRQCLLLRPAAGLTSSFTESPPVSFQPGFSPLSTFYLCFGSFFFRLLEQILRPPVFWILSPFLFSQLLLSLRWRSITQWGRVSVWGLVVRNPSCLPNLSVTEQLFSLTDNLSCVRNLHAPASFIVTQTPETSRFCPDRADGWTWLHFSFFCLLLLRCSRLWDVSRNDGSSAIIDKCIWSTLHLHFPTSV